MRNSSCLFPVSNISKRSVQKQLNNEEQAIDLIVYRTLPDDNFTVPEQDILIFTSPSNASAYLDKKEISSNQPIIAIGKSTAQQLTALGITNVKIADQVSELGLIDTMLSV